MLNKTRVITILMSLLFIFGIAGQSFGQTRQTGRVGAPSESSEHRIARIRMEEGSSAAPAMATDGHRARVNAGANSSPGTGPARLENAGSIQIIAAPLPRQAEPKSECERLSVIADAADLDLIRDEKRARNMFTNAEWKSFSACLVEARKEAGIR